MLESIHVESYRTLRNTTVTFRDGLNIIIGQNGVGKSNLLGFISTYTDSLPFESYRFRESAKSLRGGYTYSLSTTMANGKLKKIIVKAERVKIGVTPSREVDYNFAIKIMVDDTVIDEVKDLSIIDGISKARYIEEIRQAKSFWDSYITFNLPNELPHLASPGSVELSDGGEVYNKEIDQLDFWDFFEVFLAEQVADFKISETSKDISFIRHSITKAFSEMVAYLNLNEHLYSATNIEAIRLNSNINIYKKESSFLIENLILEFKVDDSWMPWSYLSDGTKRSFYIIAQVSALKNELILIEEPEIGLHPFQLQKVMTFLKEQSVTKQIILSTHSPQVLNILEPDELDQILIASIAKGRTSFNRLTDAQKEKARMYMTEVGDLSDYWLHSDLEQEEEYEGAGND